MSQFFLLRGRPILLITSMITDRIGLHSVLLTLLTEGRTIVMTTDLGNGKTQS